MEQSQAKQSVVIANPEGLHLRAASLFVELANQFVSQIRVTKEGVHADGKSIVDLLGLTAVQGTTLELAVTGEDAEDALRAIVDLIENRFHDKPNTESS